MRAPDENPHLSAFLADPWQKITVGQILIQRTKNGFDLTHLDGPGPKEIRPSDARTIANFNAKGEFRPLKSTRDLPSGWILLANSPAELDLALGYFYPNALADRFAIQIGVRPTDYRPFTERQTGMYRITTMLDDSGVARVIDRVCNSICLKRRLWTAGEIPPDAANAKSIIPCLEPCAIFLESARKEVRALQEKSAAATKADSAIDPE